MGHIKLVQVVPLLAFYFNTTQAFNAITRSGNKVSGKCSFNRQDRRRLQRYSQRMWSGNERCFLAATPTYHILNHI
jgi:hypothetical protein